MKATLPLAALCTAFALSACINNGGALNEVRFHNPSFGASVRSNIAAASVPADPMAVNSPVAADGTRQALAQSRYHNDRVKQPPDLTTSSISSASGSNAASASGGGGGSSGTPGSSY